jgi:hypothetical protein
MADMQMPSLEMGPMVQAGQSQNEPDDLMDLLKKDLDRLKSQKARPTGGVEGTTLTNLCFLNDEPYVNYRNKTLSLEAQDANKLYLSFNMVAPRVNKLMGRLSAFNAPFKARPNRNDPQALEEAEIVDRMIVALDEKLDQPSRLREILYWLLIGGTAFEFIPWVPNATIEPNAQFSPSGELLYTNPLMPDEPPVPESALQSLPNADMYEPFEQVEQVGEVGSTIFGPFNVFIDAGVRSVSDLAPDQWVHIAEVKTTGWVKENYQQDVEPQKELSLISSTINTQTGDATGTYLKDLIPLVQGAADENDPPMVLHVMSFQPPSQDHPHGRYVCWIPDQTILHDGDIPYEEIPLVDFHFSPVTTSFWSKAYVTPLIAPQRFLNKRMSQLGEQANATLYSNLLLGPGIDPSDIPVDKPGAIRNGLSDEGVPMVNRVPPPEIPQWFLQSIDVTLKMFNDAAGGADLMEDNKFPGQLRGPLAVPMLQEILDTQWGPLFSHLGERLARAKQMRLNRVKQFYPPLRTMHYTDRTQRDEVMTFHTDQILRAGTNFSITVERGSILPELRALREARLTERLRGPLAILYMDERTGRLDKSKIAADLQFGDTGREGRESKYRKLSQEIIKMLWQGRQDISPVQPFYDHKGMLDELEDSMATTEYLKASPQVQQAFSSRWQQHSQFMAQEAQMQQQAMQGQMIHTAVAQATQQAAATAAADAVHEAHQQQQAQNAQPTGQFVAQAQQQANNQARPSGPPRRPLPGERPMPAQPAARRKVTIEESH